MPSILIQPLMRLFGWSASDLSQYGIQPATGSVDAAPLDHGLAYLPGHDTISDPAAARHQDTVAPAVHPPHVSQNPAVAPTAVSHGLTLAAPAPGVSAPQSGASAPTVASSGATPLIDPRAGGLVQPHPETPEHATTPDPSGAHTPPITDTATGAATFIATVEPGVTGPGVIAYAIVPATAVLTGGAHIAAPLVGDIAGFAPPVVASATATVAQATASVTDLAAPVIDTAIAVAAPIVADVTHVAAPVIAAIDEGVAPVADAVAHVGDTVAPTLAAVDSVTAPIVADVAHAAQPILATANTALAPLATAVAAAPASVAAPVTDIAAAVVTPTVADIGHVAAPVVATAHDTVAPLAGTVSSTSGDVHGLGPTASNDTDHFAGGDPAGGIQTLVSMVDSVDAFHIGPANAAPAPVAAVVDTLVGDDLSASLLGGDHHDTHDGGLDAHHGILGSL